MTQPLLIRERDDFRSISPYLEVGAYEALWSEPGATFKRLAERFAEDPDSLPSDLVPKERALEMAAWVLARFRTAALRTWGVRIHRAGEYPQKLRDARYPVELLYYSGDWQLAERPAVAVVGTRSASEDGILRTKRLVAALVEDGWTIVSGLARGVDTTAHKSAMAVGGRTIAVLGTPLSDVYPLENEGLQSEIAAEHLVVSPVPAFRYAQQNPGSNRFFFPERNVTMSALTAATVIVEASNTSGTLVQARAALDQGRKLFILGSCFRNTELTWPERFAKLGAIRVDDYRQIRDVLGKPDDPPSES